MNKRKRKDDARNLENFLHEIAVNKIALKLVVSANLITRLRNLFSFVKKLRLLSYKSKYQKLY